MTLNDIRSAINTARITCLSLAEECSDIPDASTGLIPKQLTIDAYTERFNNLQIAVETYISDKEQKAHMLRNLISSIATLVIYGNEDKAPDTLWEYYSADRIFMELLERSPETYFEGCIIAEDSEIYTLDSYLERLKEAELKDNANRISLNNSIFGITSFFGYKALFEESTEFSFPEYTKRGLSDRVFIETGIRDIAKEYNLDVYIPSYYIEEGESV